MVATGQESLPSLSLYFPSSLAHTVQGMAMSAVRLERLSVKTLGSCGRLHLLTHNWLLCLPPAAALISPYPLRCPALCSSLLLITQND